MSLNSPAEVIPFSRFLEYRDRVHRIATAKGKVVMPAPRLTGHSARSDRSATADMPSRHGSSAIGSSTDEKAIVTVSSVTMIAATSP
jgi:hypothetical protein